MNSGNFDISKWFPEKSNKELSYPVKIVALNVGWLLHKEQGFEFLRAIDENQSMELYNIQAVQMMIELLYDTFRNKIYKWKAGIYLLKQNK